MKKRTCNKGERNSASAERATETQKRLGWKYGKKEGKR
jgi:hypothetical protein